MIILYLFPCINNTTAKPVQGLNKELILSTYVSLSGLACGWCKKEGCILNRNLRYR